MRLTDLNPRWAAGNYWRDGVEYFPSAGDPAYPNGRHGLGLTFDCPIHGEGCRLGVPFENPVDGGPKQTKGAGKNRDNWWRRDGDTFETLTLSPSLNVLDGDEGTTHWHGHITNGEVS